MRDPKTAAMNSEPVPHCQNAAMGHFIAYAGGCSLVTGMLCVTPLIVDQLARSSVVTHGVAGTIALSALVLLLFSSYNCRQCVAITEVVQASVEFHLRALRTHCSSNLTITEGFRVSGHSGRPKLRCSCVWSMQYETSMYGTLCQIRTKCATCSLRNRLRTGDRTARLRTPTPIHEICCCPHRCTYIKAAGKMGIEGQVKLTTVAVLCPVSRGVESIETRYALGTVPRSKCAASCYQTRDSTQGEARR